jgi:hypothetical protein
MSASVEPTASYPNVMTKRRFFHWWPLLYLIVTSVTIYALFSNWAYDDPFITYRYAQNLASGKGFVYNPGEHVLSTTTPLFTLLLAGLSFIWSDFHHLATMIGAISIAAGALCLWNLTRTWRNPPLLYADVVGWSGLLLYPTFSLMLNTIGSETPLYLAIGLGAFACYARRWYSITALLAALAVLVRPDGMLLAIIFTVDFVLQLLRHPPKASLTRSSTASSWFRSIPWGAVLIFVTITTTWFLFAWIYFGSPLPVTLAAKQQQGAMAISQRFAPGFLTIIKWYDSWPYWIEAALALLGIGSAVWLRRISHSHGLLIAWTILYFVSYSLLGVSRYFWYYAPLVPSFIVSIGLGLAWVAESLYSSRFFTSRRISSWQFAATPAIALLTLLLLTQSNSSLELHQHPDSRYQIYRAAGEWLSAHTSPEVSFGALEVGIIGFYADRPVVDFAGLIQPAIADRLGKSTTYEDAAIWAVEKYRPASLILQAGIFTRLEIQLANQNCSQAELLKANEYNYTHDLLIYTCQP